MARLTDSVFGEHVAETLKSSLDPSSRLPPLMSDFSSFFSSLSIAMPTTMNTTNFFLILLLLPICFLWLAFGGTLPENEVSVLKDIAKTLGKKDWDFNVDPCNWTNTLDDGMFCNCKIPNDSFCHIEKIALKSQSLQGVLPPQLNKLPYLKEIELSRNYISGSIPREWGSSNLQKISLLGNRLTGPIPNELGNLTNLTRLILEFNQLSGNLPSELGNLVLLQKLHLSSNNFTGPLPANLSRLVAMTECRIIDNQLSGNIPDWLQSWTSLDHLYKTFSFPLFLLL
ncbi:probable leucine-rich repeat receptor-like serine/threonine-protein kinase At3g14840 [Vigna umbellata]|uniref:probable leucine-rich repeat receptor-like serine/threonine-protein kinase At3g14840 n=1 Tax=Vigna umbellata TaxID=87088 RepID=UPI001F5FCF12|nr:probable leucine-rich repeat receptor-like serine/threonine-protein kinase At3g14840 [Vigna umbellata]